MLMMWHQVNGNEPPKDGKYQFKDITLGDHGILHCLDMLDEVEKVDKIRENYWDLLVELCIYFGMLAFYQQDANPTNIDPDFPADGLEKWLGLDDVLRLYQLMQNVGSYDQWPDVQRDFRQCIVRMEQHCKGCFIKKQKAK